jgi:hypothetical protein
MQPFDITLKPQFPNVERRRHRVHASTARANLARHA